MHQSFEFIEDTHVFGRHMFRKATDIMLQQLREGRVVLVGDVFDMDAFKQSHAAMVAGDDVDAPEGPKPFDFDAYNGIKR